MVIPVAGLGTRLWPATAALPKVMLPLVDRPIIEYAVEEAAAAGLQDVLFVTSRAQRAIEDHFDVPPELERAACERGMSLMRWTDNRFHFIRQNQPLGLGHAVSLAQDHTGGEAFAVMLPDDILLGPPCCMLEMAQLAERTGRPVLAVRRVDHSEVSQYGIVRPRGGGDGLYEVEDLVEKPAPEAAPSNLAVIGRYVLPAQIFGCLRRVRPGAGGEIQLTDALRDLNRHHPLLAYEFPGRVFDTGSKLGFLQATVELAMAHPQLGVEFSAYMGRRLATDGGAAAPPSMRGDADTARRG